MSSEKIIEELTKDVMALKREVERLSKLTPLYTILNENTPATITANQNNYDPGNYSALRMSANAARTVTGISSGVKGRWLLILVTGSFAITYAHQNASSSAENRIVSPTGANLAVNAGGSITLYYDSTTLRWRVPAYEL